MNEKAEKMEIDTDELSFVFETYGSTIFKHLGTDIGVMFFAQSEDYFDEYQTIESSLKYPKLLHNEVSVTFFQDYSVDKPTLVTDIGVAKIKKLGSNEMLTIIKVVTPFTRERTYDFLLGNRKDMRDIIDALKKKKSEDSFTYHEDFPIIGLGNVFDDIKRNTIDFLLDEDLRKYCVEKHIKLKRGVVFEGKPGVGKTLTIQWLKNQALKHNIKFHSFQGPRDFMDNRYEYFDSEKKILVFEDFDTMLQERKETGYSPNEILGAMLNTLEGVNDINNVVSIFTTNQVKIFDGAFMRPGRIDKVYTYDLPKPEVYGEFFRAYIPEEEQYHEKLTSFLKSIKADVTFAILKGICDEINIYKFSGKELTEEVAIALAEEKVKGAEKNEKPADLSDFVL